MNLRNVNLRFKYTVLTSWKHVSKEVPTANRMIAHKEEHSAQERFDYAKVIMNNLRRRSRSTTKVYGQSNIPKEGNFIICSNHQGKYDALGILLSLDRPCSVLWDIKQASRLVSRQICGLIDAVIIDLRNDKDKVRAIRDVTKFVKQGGSILMFPEGGYADNRNDLQEFQTGCFSSCLKGGAPIVPVALYDSWKAMNSNSFKKVVTEVHFLAPIPYEEFAHMKKAEVAALVKDRIGQRMQMIKQGGIDEEYGWIR